MERTSPTTLALTMLALTIMLGVGDAAADDDIERAKSLFDNGVELVAAEDFPSALAAFEQSYEIAPRPTTLFNIGMCQKGMFLYVEARDTFERYLVDTAEEGETELRQKARLATEELDQLVGRLLVTGAPDGAEIQVDGKRAGVTPLGWPIDVNPGVHAVRVEKEGHQPFETSVTVGSATEAEIAAEMPRIAQQPEEPIDEYAALLAKAEAAKLNKHERAKRLEAEWIKVARIAFEESLGREERALVLDHFLDTYPTRNPHKQKAKLYKEALEEGEEPADVLDPECMRTKTEWVALRIGGGNYGGTGMLSVVTLRWELFVWDILRVSGGGGVSESIKTSGDGESPSTRDERKWLAAGGTGIGIPWHFEDTGRFEIRFGVGLMIGHIENAEADEDLLGLILVPEGVLVWHAFEYFALQAGIDLQLATVDFKGSGTTFPTPGLGAFLGARF